jgi:hypothetical protein
VKEKACAACGEPYDPLEPATNRLVAQAARWPGIGPVIWRSIWPENPLTDCPACGAPLTFWASSVGADWCLCCAAGHPVCQAENKPGGAPGHWAWARVTHYKRALERGVIIRGPAWPGIPAKLHERPHPWIADQCWSCAAVKGTGGRICRLAIPQVVRYSIDTGLPCTLVTDQVDATAVYGSLPHFTINPDMVPVRTVPQLLNALGASVHGLTLAGYQEEILRDIATRLWWRSPWDQEPAIDERARELVRRSAYLCAGNSPFSPP